MNSVPRRSKTLEEEEEFGPSAIRPKRSDRTVASSVDDCFCGRPDLLRASSLCPYVWQSNG